MDSYPLFGTAKAAMEDLANDTNVEADVTVDALTTLRDEISVHLAALGETMKGGGEDGDAKPEL